MGRRRSSPSATSDPRRPLACFRRRTATRRLAGVAHQLQQAPNPTIEPNRIVLLLACVGSADGTGRDSWPPACSRRSMTTVSQTATENGRFARLLGEKRMDRQRRLLLVRCPRSRRACLPRQQKRQKSPVCRANEKTGARGLEPATSGVTGVTKPLHPASRSRTTRVGMRLLRIHALPSPMRSFTWFHPVVSMRFPADRRSGESAVGRARRQRLGKGQPA
jgi:hypothetical protein